MIQRAQHHTTHHGLRGLEGCQPLQAGLQKGKKCSGEILGEEDTAQGWVGWLHTGFHSLALRRVASCRVALGWGGSWRSALQCVVPDCVACSTLRVCKVSSCLEGSLHPPQLPKIPLRHPVSRGLCSGDGGALLMGRRGIEGGEDFKRRPQSLLTAH